MGRTIVTDPLRASLDAAMAGPADDDVPGDYDPGRVDSEPTGPPDGTCAHVAVDVDDDHRFDVACTRDATEWKWDPVTSQFEARCHVHGVGYRVRTEAGASKAIRRLRAARAEIEAVKKLYDEEHARLNAWFDMATRAPTRTARFYETHLISWLRQQRRQDPNRKSVRLPGGRVWASLRPQKVEVVDRDAFLGWAADNQARWAACVRDAEPDVLVGRSGDGKLPGLKSLLYADEDGELQPYVDGDDEKIPGIVVGRDLDGQGDTIFGVDTPGTENP